MARYYAQISGPANITTNFNPYTNYTGNGNYLRLEYVGNITTDATSYAYVWKEMTSQQYFSFQQDSYQQHWNLGNTAYVTGVDFSPNAKRKFNSDSLSNPANFEFNNSFAVLTFNERETYGSFTSDLPNESLRLFPTTYAVNLEMDFYELKVYGSGDTLLYDFVPDLSGSTKGLRDNVSGNFFSASDQSKITLIQMSSPLLVPKNNIYRGGNLVN